MRVPRYNGPQIESTNLRGNYSDGGISAKTFGADIAQGLGDVAGVMHGMYEKQQAEADESALLGFDNDMSGIETDLLHNPETGAYTRQGSEAFDREEKVMPDWDKRQSEALNKLPGRLRAKAQNLASRRRNDAQRGIMRHTMGQAELYGKQQAEAKVANDTNAAILNYRDDDRLAESLAGIEVATDKLVRGAPEEMRQLAQAKARSNLFAGVIGRHLQDGAVAGEKALERYGKYLDAETTLQLTAKITPLVNARNDEADLKILLDGGEPERGTVPLNVAETFEAAARDVLKIEGGYVANDAGKGPTNFGINSSANPDVDVKGLTPQQATKLYKERYWDAIGASDLPPELRAAAFDCAVNQGVGKAKELLRACEGDLGKFLALRKEHYRALIRDNPAKFKQHERGWMARVDRFGRPAGGAPAAASAAPRPTNEVETLRRIETLYADDPEKRERLSALARREWGMRDAERIETERAVHESVYQKIYAADPRASFDSLLTSEERDQLVKDGNYDTFEAELTGRATGKVKQSDPELVYALEREALLSPDTFAKRNILRSVEHLDNADLSRLLGHQSKLRDPAQSDKAKADWATEDQRISRGAAQLGFEGNKKADKRQAFATFYRMAEQAFIQTHGKKPDGDQADKLLRQSVQAFASDPERQVKQVKAAEALAMGQPVQGASGPVSLTEGDRATVVSVLKRRGIANPTEAQVLQAAGNYYGAAQ